MLEFIIGALCGILVTMLKFRNENQFFKTEHKSHVRTIKDLHEEVFQLNYKLQEIDRKSNK